MNYFEINIRKIRQNKFIRDLKALIVVFFRPLPNKLNWLASGKYINKTIKWLFLFCYFGERTIKLDDLLHDILFASINLNQNFLELYFYICSFVLVGLTIKSYWHNISIAGNPKRQFGSILFLLCKEGQKMSQVAKNDWIMLKN